MPTLSNKTIENVSLNLLKTALYIQHSLFAKWHSRWLTKYLEKYGKPFYYINLLCILVYISNVVDKISYMPIKISN